MDVQQRPGAALAVLVAGILIVAAKAWLVVAESGPSATEDFFQLLVNLSFVLLGAVTVWRRPDNRMSWLFAWVGIVTGLSLLMDDYGTFEFAGARPPLADVASWLSAWLWVPAFGPLLLLLLLWFPTGRVPSPRWMPVERTSFALIGGMTLLLMFGQDPESSGVNPLAIGWVTAIAEKIIVVIGPVFPLLVASCLASVVVRFRRSRGEERQQLKWFVLAAALLLTYIVGDTLTVSFGRDRPVWIDLLEVTAFLALPIAAGVAILKYRLYDIDVVINRTLVYGALTATLLATYLVIVFALSRVLDPVTRDSDVAVAASTLAVAALFRPVRARIQQFIDRRFYRNKYDAVQAVGDFAARLRDEVDIDAVRSDIVSVIADTLHPRQASVWIRTRGVAR